MSERLFYFLLVRELMDGSTRVEQHANETEAFRAYIAAERSVEGDRKVEVLLLSAESEEAVRQAYPQFFREGDRDHRLRELMGRLAPA